MELFKNVTRPYAVISMNDDNYKPLADITWAGKTAYCKKWGYDAIHFPVGVRDEISLKTEGHNHFFGFAKIQNVLSMLETNAFLWVMFSECDAMFTNYDISLESLVDDNFHVLLSGCFNGINAGNFMVRNTEQGKEYLKFILSEHEKYKPITWAEQQVMLDNRENPRFKSVVKIVPQRTFNSYDDFLYVLHKIGDRRDHLGLSGEWQPGDFQVHWPGMGLEQRLGLAKKYLTKIIDTEKLELQPSC